MIFAKEVRAYPSGAPYWSPVKELPLALATNFKLEWKLFAMTNALAYYISVVIKRRKSIMVQP